MLNQTEDLRYPVGEFHAPALISPELRKEWLTVIREFPAAMRSAVAGLDDAQLDTPYREGGWTLRQVVHHCADSHINAYTRFRLALTEDNPTIRPYIEARWAELADAKTQAVEVSLPLIEALHYRWYLLLNAMSEEQWQRSYYHPESNRTFLLDRVLGMYAWHCRHHCAHITNLRERMGWA